MRFVATATVVNSANKFQTYQGVFEAESREEAIRMLVAQYNLTDVVLSDAVHVICSS